MACLAPHVHKLPSLNSSWIFGSRALTKGVAAHSIVAFSGKLWVSIHWTMLPSLSCASASKASSRDCLLLPLALQAPCRTNHFVDPQIYFRSRLFLGFRTLSEPWRVLKATTRGPGAITTPIHSSKGVLLSFSVQPLAIIDAEAVPHGILHG